MPCRAVPFIVINRDIFIVIIRRRRSRRPRRQVMIDRLRIAGTAGTWPDRRRRTIIVTRT